jgi:peptidoglycan/xylan/chitin deacetylase (PgdA/CDA1 family)
MCFSRRCFHGYVLATAFSSPDPIVEPSLRLIVSPDQPKTVALTLDACSGLVDWRILSTLDRLSLPATIFATGLWLRGNATALAWLRERTHLFSLQNHGAQHLPAVLGTRRIYGLPVAGTMDAIRNEVVMGGDAITQHTGAPATWYRSAAGRYSSSAIPLIQSLGFRVAGYSCNGDAGASLPAAAVAQRIGAAVSGDVIVAHVNQPNRASGAGVAEGVRALHDSGMVFVKLDDRPTQMSERWPQR